MAKGMSRNQLDNRPCSNMRFGFRMKQHCDETSHEGLRGACKQPQTFSAWRIKVKSTSRATWASPGWSHPTPSICRG